MGLAFRSSPERRPETGTDFTRKPLNPQARASLVSQADMRAGGETVTVGRMMSRAFVRRPCGRASRPRHRPMPLSRRSLFALDFSGRVACRRRLAACAPDGDGLPLRDQPAGDRSRARRRGPQGARGIRPRRYDALGRPRETSEVAPYQSARLAASRCRLRGLFDAPAILRAGLHARPRGPSISRAAARAGVVRRHAREGRQPTPAELAAARSSVGLHRVSLDPERSTVRLSSTAGSHRELRRRSARAMRVDRMGAGPARPRRRPRAGVGRRQQRARDWRPRQGVAGRRAPALPASAVRIWLRDGALGTSGIGGQFVLVDGRRTRTGRRSAHRARAA